MTLSTSGTISGTPTTLGTWDFTYAATDASSASAHALGVIKVELWGDWNNDGVVDGADVATIISIISSFLLDD